MFRKVMMSLLVVFTVGLVFADSADARGRRGRGCSGSARADNYYYAQSTYAAPHYESARVDDGRRMYSYEPSADYYPAEWDTRGWRSGGRDVPQFMLPKSDPRKYDPR